MADANTKRITYFYNSKNGDRKYDADSFGDLFDPFFTDGVFYNDFFVRANGDMSVTVEGGYAKSGKRTVHQIGEEKLDIVLASGNLSRIDSIVLRRDDTLRDMYPLYVQGSNSYAPTAPKLIRENGIYDFRLANISIKPGAIKIEQSDITDCRINKEECGWVMSTVEEIDFSQVVEQFTDFFNNYEKMIDDKYKEYVDSMNGIENTATKDFNDWFEHIKDQLSEDAAGNLQNQFDELKKENQSQIDTVAQNAVNAIGQVTATDDTDADGELIRFSLVQEGFKLFNGAKVIIYNPFEHSGKRLTLNVGETGDYPIKTYDSAGEHIWGLGGVLSLVYYDGVYYAQGLQETVFNAENIGGEPASNIPKLDATNTFVGNQKISNGNLAIRYAQLSSTGTQELSITADGSLGWGSIKLGVKTDWSLYPSSDNSNILGHPNNRWRQLYCANSTISTSDRTQKKDIEDLEDDFVAAMIEKLLPKQYKMIDGTSDRTHVGFIAQDVEDLLYEIGKTSLDFAGFIKSPVQEEYTEINENGEKVTKYRDVAGKYVYGLRYEEFIALQTRYIQILSKRVSALEKQ